MKKQVLTQATKDAIRNDVYLQADLCHYNDISVITLNRVWLANDHESLVGLNNLQIIRNRLKLPDDATLTEATEDLLPQEAA